MKRTIKAYQDHSGMFIWGRHCISWRYTRTRRFLYLRNAFGHGKLLISTKRFSKYRKIPKIILGAYIFQRPFLRDWYTEGNFVLKAIGLAHSCKEIYVCNLQQVFSETRLDEVDLSKNSAIQVLWVYMDWGTPSWLQWTTQTAPWIYHDTLWLQPFGTRN